MTRVLVVGAGPAGLSAALWCRSLGLPARVLESADRAGGQLHSIYSLVENYPGLHGVGAELAAAFERQARAASLDVRFAAVAEALDLARGEVTLRGGGREQGECLVLATGTRRRALGVPGEERLRGAGVSISATRDRERYRGRPVIVVGGGDAAFENALLLSDVGCQVTLVVRGSEPRARGEFRRRVAERPAVEVLTGTQFEAVLGESRVEGVRLSGPSGLSERPADAVFVKIGMVPSTDWCRKTLPLDADGYPIVGPDARVPGHRVWAVGDLLRPPLPSLAHAVGSGARAAAEILRVLEG